MAMTLKTGLEWFIQKVEAMPAETEFTMPSHKNCVIGQIYGWGLGSNKFKDGAFVTRSDEVRVLFRRFGILRNESDRMLFSDNSSALYKPHQWEVIRLFTSDIGNYVSREDWLVLAKAQLAKMNGIELKDVEDTPLKAGLRRLIDEVESRPEITEFEMDCWNNCVVGQTIGWDIQPRRSSWLTVKQLFGIDKAGPGSPLCPDTQNEERIFTDEEWAVVKLISPAVTDEVYASWSEGNSDIISRADWLKVAKAQLEKM